jgi:DNA-binding transcriptional ArsR family regulator
MQAFDVLGDPVRRRILELLAGGERSAGDITSVVTGEFGISQPAVSQHLRVLRESGFTNVRPAGARRLYAVDPIPLREVDGWLEQFRRSWEESYERLDEVLEKLKHKKEEE